MHAHLFVLLSALCAALSAAALQMQSRWLMYGYLYEWGILAAFTAFSTLFAYLFTATYRLWRRIAWLIAAPVAAILYLYLSPQQQCAALPGAALWMLYYGWPPPRLWKYLKRLSAHSLPGLRAWPLGKPLLVAGAWAWVTVLLPLYPADWSAACWMQIERTAFVFALALAYDLHDLEYDTQMKLRTLAQRLRERRTFYLIYAALGLSAMAVAVAVFEGKYAPSTGMVLALSLGGSAIGLHAIFREHFPPRWRKVAIDALMLAQAVLVAAQEMINILLGM